jgi:hypothetical protein
MKMHSFAYVAAPTLAALLALTAPAAAQDPKPPAAQPARPPAVKAQAPKQLPKQLPKQAPAAAPSEEAAPAPEEAAEAEPEADVEDETKADAATEEASSKSEEVAGDAEEGERETADRARARRVPAAQADPLRAAAPPPFVPVGPAELEYIEGADIPPGYVKREKIRAGLVAAGAALTLSLWLASAQAAIVLDEEGDSEGVEALYAPVVGPFIAMKTTDSEGAMRSLLFMDGLVQTAGLGMFIAGLAAPRTVVVRNSYGSVSFAPGLGSMGLAGTF